MKQAFGSVGEKSFVRKSGSSAYKVLTVPHAYRKIPIYKWVRNDSFVSKKDFDKGSVSSYHKIRHAINSDFPEVVEKIEYQNRDGENCEVLHGLFDMTRTSLEIIRPFLKDLQPPELRARTIAHAAVRVDAASIFCCKKGRVDFDGNVMKCDCASIATIYNIDQSFFCCKMWNCDSVHHEYAAGPFWLKHEESGELDMNQKENFMAMSKDFLEGAWGALVADAGDEGDSDAE